MFPQWNKTEVYIENENKVYKTKEELLKKICKSNNDYENKNNSV